MWRETFLPELLARARQQIGCKDQCAGISHHQWANHKTEKGSGVMKHWIFARSGKAKDVFTYIAEAVLADRLLEMRFGQWHKVGRIHQN